MSESIIPTCEFPASANRDALTSILRAGAQQMLAAAMLFVVVMVVTLAVYILIVDQIQTIPFFTLVAILGLGIGLFTSATYAMYMNLTLPFIAATQFSTFMGAVNACESWSTYVLGRFAGPQGAGFGIGMIVLCAISLLALPVLWITAAQSERQQQDVFD